jgi:hypothetical protein
VADPRAGGVTRGHESDQDGGDDAQMGTPRRVSTTTADSGLAVEYVKSRRVLRLLGHHRGQDLPELEIPIDRLCEELAIEPRQLGSPETLLLFAGVQGDAGGGLRDLVGTFATEEEGRRAFARLREQHPALGGWAELAAVDGFGRVRQIRWFGVGQHPGTAPRRRGASGDVVAMANRRQGLRRLIGVPGERRPDDVSSF